MANGLSKLLITAASALDRRFGWDKLPRPLGVLTLVGLRMRLREKNLYDTGAGSAKAGPDDGPHDHQDVRRQLQRPAAAGDGHGRRPLRPQRSRSSARIPRPLPQLLSPTRGTVSRELLTRDEFVPATTLNVLAAAWLQFEVHDWFSHGQNDREESVASSTSSTVTTRGRSGRCRFARTRATARA